MKTILFVLFVALNGFAQTGSKVFIDPGPQKPGVITPMEVIAIDFAGAITKKKVPVIVTVRKADAQYIVDFSNASYEGSKARGITSAVLTGWYNSGAWNQISMRVTDQASGEVTFSYTCKKSGTDTQSAAECLAKHWKQKLEKR